MRKNVPVCGIHSIYSVFDAIFGLVYTLYTTIFSQDYTIFDILLYFFSSVISTLLLTLYK